MSSRSAWKLGAVIAVVALAVIIWHLAAMTRDPNPPSWPEWLGLVFVAIAGASNAYYAVRHYRLTKSNSGTINDLE